MSEITTTAKGNTREAKLEYVVRSMLGMPQFWEPDNAYHRALKATALHALGEHDGTGLSMGYEFRFGLT